MVKFKLTEEMRRYLRLNEKKSYSKIKKDLEIKFQGLHQYVKNHQHEYLTDNNPLTAQPQA